VSEYKVPSNIEHITVHVGYDESHKGYYVKTFNSPLLKWNEKITNLIMNTTDDFRIAQLYNAYTNAILGDSSKDIGYISNLQSLNSFIAPIGRIPNEVLLMLQADHTRRN
jgi:hypothetical protein